MMRTPVGMMSLFDEISEGVSFLGKRHFKKPS
jgi:hypothetical protein